MPVKGVMTIFIPGDAWRPLGANPEIVANEIRLAAAMKLFELGRLSSGAAARLARVSRVELLARAASFVVDVLAIDGVELDADLLSA